MFLNGNLDTYLAQLLICWIDIQSCFRASSFINRRLSWGGFYLQKNRFRYSFHGFDMGGKLSEWQLALNQLVVGSTPSPHHKDDL